MTIAPPDFLRLAGHRLRWELLTLLADGDRPVRELTALAGQPQNLVSYHLAQLRSGGLVRSRRSSADGRDTFYALDLHRCGELLTGTGAALHAGLRLTPPAPPVPPQGTRVLFLCTGNSARSQLAEAMARAGGLDAFSAGSHPKPLHPNTSRIMRERGLDPSGHEPKSLDVFRAEPFDLVVTLCDKVREVCPEFEGGPPPVHWSIPDPAIDGSDAAFAACAEELAVRTGFLLARLAA
ncbi:arsenate reductase/protein-tyrosine-phosphatase family protein [Phytomonospora endophytica]|uniref:Protein-tyrosine-phosphatase/DNA-binding transcriptional ArsR family regulator n=1 Tax=Phytomonospora endophytica TaxID=714109 RepID=A0A841FFV4_9ACTN|nr:ArsR family transcriptional regulator [Phytomonospora endophytica]MBB6034485.1 protein-tyrosine-phosphatase/DNA-binding transcriptional ArsR family regulator [Phytomonospora endophytica]GIG70392.1 ArsR family transcriptional regulator [Phytomonospora endophytica]